MSIAKELRICDFSPTFAVPHNVFIKLKKNGIIRAGGNILRKLPLKEELNKMKMKKVIIATLLVTSFFSCKEKNGNNDSVETATEQVETQKKESKTAKFDDTNGCSQYSNVYKAIPQLDSYKNIDFYEMECQSTKEKSAFSVALDVKYEDKKSKNTFSATFFEISGESVKEELNVVNTAKATVTMADQLAKNSGEKLFVKSNLKTLDFATIEIHDAPNDSEMSSYVYTGVYKNKYVVKLCADTDKKIEVTEFESLIKEYLEAIKLNELN